MKKTAIFKNCESGSNEYNNLAISCQWCNLKKHSKTEAEFREVNN